MEAPSVQVYRDDVPRPLFSLCREHICAHRKRFSVLITFAWLGYHYHHSLYSIPLSSGPRDKCPFFQLFDTHFSTRQLLPPLFTTSPLSLHHQYWNLHTLFLPSPYPRGSGTSALSSNYHTLYFTMDNRQPPTTTTAKDEEWRSDGEPIDMFDQQDLRRAIFNEATLKAAGYIVTSNPTKRDFFETAPNACNIHDDGSSPTFKQDSYLPITESRLRRVWFPDPDMSNDTTMGCPEDQLAKSKALRQSARKLFEATDAAAAQLVLTARNDLKNEIEYTETHLQSATSQGKASAGTLIAAAPLDLDVELVDSKKRWRCAMDKAKAFIASTLTSAPSLIQPNPEENAFQEELTDNTISVQPAAADPDKPSLPGQLATLKHHFQSTLFVAKRLDTRARQLVSNVLLGLLKGCLRQTLGSARHLEGSLSLVRARQKLLCAHPFLREFQVVKGKNDNNDKATKPRRRRTTKLWTTSLPPIQEDDEHTWEIADSSGDPVLLDLQERGETRNPLHLSARGDCNAIDSDIDSEEDSNSLDSGRSWEITSSEENPTSSRTSITSEDSDIDDEKRTTLLPPTNTASPGTSGGRRRRRSDSLWSEKRYRKLLLSLGVIFT